MLHAVSSTTTSTTPSPMSPILPPAVVSLYDWLIMACAAACARAITDDSLRKPEEVSDFKSLNQVGKSLLQ